MLETDRKVATSCQGAFGLVRKPRPRRKHETGAFAVMTAVLIVVILGVCGLAINLSRMFNRKVEMQAVADAVAMAAAKELDGTNTGVSRALAAAEQIASRHFYDYNLEKVQWSDSAIFFGTTPSGTTWLDSATAKQPANASTLFFVKVDTGRLAVEHGTVPVIFSAFLGAGNSVQVGSTATAGRTSINAMPLAICAMSNVPGAARGTELVEYGFRRGVSYNLMKLNPNDSTKGANYLINPFSLPGASGTSVINRMDLIRPFICTGTLAIPTLSGGNITVESGFPLSSVYAQLNSRFASYTSPCNSNTAPPDTNIKEFTYSTEFPWMNSQPTSQAAETRVRATPTQLLTIADLPPAEIPGTTTGGMYGPLWIYAQAVVKDSKYVGSELEPAGGYTKFGTTDWPNLYTPGSQKVKSGSSYQATPYKLVKKAPPNGVSGVADRRILNVPLLRCPVPTGSSPNAEVVAVAKFFMTVSATDKDLYAEFAGLVAQKTLTGQVELYP